MNNLKIKMLSRYTYQIARLEKKINFYRMNPSEKSTENIKKIEIKISRLNEKASDLNMEMQKEAQLKIVELKKIDTADGSDKSKDIIQQINILSAKDKVISDKNHMISLAHLTMKFGGLKAVDDLSLSVKKGEIFGLIGPNGAGKTTVFNCITQFYKPSAGAVFYTDAHGEVHNLTNFKVHNIIDLGIARTFQNVELVWELSIMDNLLVGAHSLYTAGFFSQLFHLPKLKKEESLLKEKAIEILKSLDLLSYKDMVPYGLPYGILKKVEFARVLMTNPRLIILDEPAAGLNDTETKELAKTILDIKLKYDLTIILVEHDMELVMDICDRICAMSFGQKLTIGTPAEVQSNKEVQTAYLGGE